MDRTGYSPGQLWGAIREEVRSTRAANTARRSLRRELASYTRPGELNDLDATLQRYSEDETADIRSILAGRPRG